MGVHNRNLKESWSVSRKASLLIINPEWDANQMRGDIAMIKLNVNISFSHF